MKNSISKIIIGIIVLIIGIGIFVCYNNIVDKEKGMHYKFENDKLMVSVYSDEWIEVPYDFTYTIRYLEEKNNGKYRDGTYQMTEEKIIFYTEQDISKINDNNGNIIVDLEQNAIINLIYSNDKGKTWQKTELGTVTSRDAIISINFENKYKGRIVVKNNAGNTESYITDDGGENWSVEQDKVSNIERVSEDELSIPVSNSNTEPGTCVYKAFNVLNTEELHIAEFSVSNGLYFKKVVSYDEYLKYKNMWCGIRKLTKEDFANYYLILIVDKNANENVSYTFKNILVEDEYLNLNITQREANINEKQEIIATGIAIIIPNRTDFEENKINIVLDK